MKKYLERTTRFFDKRFLPRWLVYNNLLKSSIDDNTKWLDIGCGKNSWVKEFGSSAKLAIGTDVYDSDEGDSFIKCDLKSLPFDDESFDLLTLRFVVEHLDDIEDKLKEYSRVLKKNGKIIILTTNTLNPFIYVAKFIPEWIKTPFLSKMFKTDSQDIFPTTHPLNKPSDYKKLEGSLKLENIDYISDINTSNIIFYIIFLFWHLITMPRFLNRFRTNLLVTLKKD